MNNGIKTYGIAISGGIATGKSTVAKLLTGLGYEVIDADVLARDLVQKGQKGLEGIVAHFGKEVLEADGSLNRKHLRGIVFTSPEQRRKLEQILHPLIQERLLSTMQERGLDKKENFWFYEAALLVETGVHKRFRELWVTLCKPEEQLRRLISRDKIDRAFAKQILSQQLDPQEKAKQADFVLDTEQELGVLEAQIKTRLALLKIQNEQTTTGAAQP